MRPIDGPETSVRIHRYKLRNNPEERKSFLFYFSIRFFNSSKKINQIPAKVPAFLPTLCKCGTLKS